VVNFFFWFRFLFGVGTGRNKKEERCLTIDRSFWTGKVLKKKQEGGRIGGRDCEDLANGGGGCGAANVPVAANFA
jgi:hypothetical protein